MGALLTLAALLPACSGQDGENTERGLPLEYARPAPHPHAAMPAASSPVVGVAVSGELTQGGWIRGSLPRETVGATLGERALQYDEEGAFFAGLDRDEEAQVPLVVTLEDGRTIRRTLEIAPRQWQISHVNIARRPSGSSEEWWKRREPEWNAIQDARAKETGATGWKQRFAWPVKGRISGKFGRQRIYRGEPGSYHSGLDIAPGNGVPFRAPADGVVVLARTGFSLEGGLIIVDHGQGLNSAFLHASKIMVEEGERVRQGQHIGNVGASGRATGPHLHWSITWRGARLDPLLFVGDQ